MEDFMTDLMKLIMLGRTGNFGLEYTGFFLNTGGFHAEISLSSCSCRTGSGASEQDHPILSLEKTQEGLLLSCDAFPASAPFSLTAVLGDESRTFTAADILSTEIEGLDPFEALEENGVLYRLYSPASSSPRPLLLFLHGGGECGYDNLSQMTGTLGAIPLARSYPELFVMAPQAPGRLSDMIPDKNAFYQNTFSGFRQPEGTGWHREYLAKICDIIRRLVQSGRVDRDRIYVTGLSMGGAGTLRALSVGAGLFAAAAPVCPTMTPETYGILCSLTDTGLWISTAYADHTLYRHKYLVDAVMKLKDEGNRNVHLTLYAPEELEKYGISVDPGISLTERLSQNHNSWILTYHNEHGILDWLISQHK